MQSANPHFVLVLCSTAKLLLLLMSFIWRKFKGCSKCAKVS